MRHLVVMGGGPGGYVAALRAAQRGARVTVIEPRGLGGTCLQRGCIPTKALIATADLVMRIRRSRDMAVRVTGEATVDLGEAIARKNRLVAAQADGIARLFKAAGVTHVQGTGMLTSPRTVEVLAGDGRVQILPCDGVIIATGSEPSKPALFPFDGRRVLTSDDLLDLTALPSRLLIAGGGVTGCEFACIFRALGSEVTIIEPLERVVASEDEAISLLLHREMKKQGIRILLGTSVTGVEDDGDGVRVRLSSGDPLAGDRLLVAVGRSLNSRGIGADTVGVRMGPRGELSVDDGMETGIDGLWAIGDVIGRKQLAHAASAEGEVAAERATGGEARMAFDAVPAGIFTFPEIGSIGLTEAQARAGGDEVAVGEFPFRGLAKSHLVGETAGLVKVVAAAGTGKLLGVHIVGPHAAELIHEAVIALRVEATVEDLIGAIHVHPTLAEVVHEAAGAARGLAIHAVNKGPRG